MSTVSHIINRAGSGALFGAGAGMNLFISNYCYAFYLGDGII